MDQSTSTVQMKDSSCSKVLLNDENSIAVFHVLYSTSSTFACPLRIVRSKSQRYFTKAKSANSSSASQSVSIRENTAESGASAVPAKSSDRPSWRVKSRDEYAAGVHEETGQMIDATQQPTNRYFKRTILVDIILLHGFRTIDDEVNVKVFCHFLRGMLYRALGVAS